MLNGSIADRLGTGNTSMHSSPNSRKRPTKLNVSGVISPLDIGLSQTQLLREDLPYLSPVYETRTPSPSASRKFEHVLDRKSNGTSDKIAAAAIVHSTSPLQHKQVNGSSQLQNKPNSGPTKTNGHTRGAKSESGAPAATWQKAGGKKKKLVASDNVSGNNNNSLSEKMPRKESDRKGG